MYLLSKLVLAVGVIIAPFSALAAPDWQLFGSSSQYSVDIDINSIKVDKADGMKVWAKIRTAYAEEIEALHDGKKVKGAYSISEVTADCGADKMVFHSSILYDKAHKEVTSRQQIGDVQNPRQAGSFITAYLELMCHGAKNSKPSLTI